MIVIIVIGGDRRRRRRRRTTLKAMRQVAWSRSRRTASTSPCWSSSCRSASAFGFALRSPARLLVSRLLGRTLGRPASQPTSQPATPSARGCAWRRPTRREVGPASPRCWTRSGRASSRRRPRPSGHWSRPAGAVALGWPRSAAGRPSRLLSCRSFSLAVVAVSGTSTALPRPRSGPRCTGRRPQRSRFCRSPCRSADRELVVVRMVITYQYRCYLGIINI